VSQRGPIKVVRLDAFIIMSFRHVQIHHVLLRKPAFDILERTPFSIHGGDRVNTAFGNRVDVLFEDFGFEIGRHHSSVTDLLPEA